MVNKHHLRSRIALATLISTILCLFQPNLSFSASAPAQQTELQNSSNTTTQQQQYITGKGVSCSGSIASELEGPSSGLPYAYLYKVNWSIKSTGMGDYDKYSITYGGDGVTTTTKANQLDAYIPNPYPVYNISYQFKKIDPDKTVTLNVSMTDYTVSPSKTYSSSCSLFLDNKGAEDTSGTTFALQQITPVTTPTTDTTPSYTFKTPRAGSITYGGNCSSPSSNASVGNNTVTFNTLSAGTYSNCTIIVTDANSITSSALTVSSFTIESANTSSDSSTDTSSDSSTDTSTDNQTTEGTTEQTSTQSLTPSPDILTCKKRADTLYFENDEPAYDRFGVDCVLTMGALVDAGIYGAEFDPKATDLSAGLIKTIKTDEILSDGQFYIDWTGYDDYDQVAALGEYTFVIMASVDSQHSPDISLQTFSIANVPSPDDTAAAENVTGEDLKSAAPEEKTEGVLESVAKAIFGDNSATTEEQAKAANREASKCPNIYYPTDIESSPYKDKIRQAYDECLVRGYDDGTFRPQQSLTRAEATKIIILASGNLAKQGCFDNDCGSPFGDLDSWQGPWVRSAWDLKIVSGVGPNVFAPNRSITRAEAVALVTKGFGIPPHVGCYDADCGANYQKDIFTDIVLMWEGPYLRALADKGVIESAAPGKFFPDVAITREQFVDISLKAKAVK